MTSLLHKLNIIGWVEALPLFIHHSPAPPLLILFLHLQEDLPLGREKEKHTSQSGSFEKAVHGHMSS